MRNLCCQTVVCLLFFVLSPVAQSEVYPFMDIKVTQQLTTAVEFDQKELKNYQKNDNLKLRVLDGNDVVREDAILNKSGHWVWNKVLPFSENLKFLVLKNNKPISGQYLADTKSLWTSSAADSLPMMRDIEYRFALQKQNNNGKVRLPINLQKFKDCKDKILVIVYDKETKALLWQYYGMPKEGLNSDEIDYSDNLQPAIVTDEGSCDK